MLIAFVVASEEVANSFCKFLVSLIILSVELLMVLHEVCIQLIILVIASTFVSIDFIFGEISSINFFQLLIPLIQLRSNAISMFLNI